MTDSVEDQQPGRNALILFGSETGNSQDVAEELGRVAERLHFASRVCEMDVIDITHLSRYTFVLFVTSTTGQGEFPRNARKFWKSLLRKRLPPNCLSHVTFTTFGLGDSSYAKYNISTRKLHKRLGQLGANEFYPRGEGDDQHEEGYEGTFLPWCADFRKHLLAVYPLRTGLEPIPPGVFLVPEFQLVIEEDIIIESEQADRVSQEGNMIGNLLSTLCGRQTSTTTDEDNLKMDSAEFQPTLDGSVDHVMQDAESPSQYGGVAMQRVGDPRNGQTTARSDEGCVDQVMQDIQRPTHDAELNARSEQDTSRNGQTTTKGNKEPVESQKLSAASVDPSSSQSANTPTPIPKSGIKVRLTLRNKAATTASPSSLDGTKGNATQAQKPPMPSSISREFDQVASREFPCPVTVSPQPLDAYDIALNVILNEPDVDEVVDEGKRHEVTVPTYSVSEIIPSPYFGSQLGSQPGKLVEYVYQPPRNQREREQKDCDQLKTHVVDSEPVLDSVLSRNDASRQHIRGIPEMFYSLVLSNKRITPESHFQDVRLLTLLIPKPVPAAFRGDDDPSNTNYVPGDVLVIYPENFPEDVQTLIELMGWEDYADMRLKFKAKGPRYFEDPLLITSHPPGLHPMPRTTLRQLLTYSLDITAIPNRHFFEVCANFTSDETHKQRLLEFSNPTYSDEYFDYATRPRRSILEVLQDFPTVKLPLVYACNYFPYIKGRKYSIASGGWKRDAGERFPAWYKVELLIALVKYQTVLKKVRQGLCSRFIATLPPRTGVWMTLESNPSFTQKLRLNHQHNILMIAPGTGVAPCRSLIWERERMRVEASAGEDVDLGRALLFFGGRNQAADYFFKEEWQYKSLRLEVKTAFSRDQREKIYVQDIIRKEAKLLYELLTERRTIIYICGSAGKMPEQVRAALVDVLTWCEGLGVETAEEKFKKMEKDGMVIQETW